MKAKLMSMMMHMLFCAHQSIHAILSHFSPPTSLLHPQPDGSSIDISTGSYQDFVFNDYGVTGNFPNFGVNTIGYNNTNGFNTDGSVDDVGYDFLTVSQCLFAHAADKKFLLRQARFGVAPAAEKCASDGTL